MRRFVIIAVLLTLAFGVACTNKKVSNPLADVNSKQPDKVLFDRAMDSLKHNHYDVARLSLETLINTYPDSEYIARAKLALADSWYAEGTSAGYAQAEIQYKDFITFFPNMQEAAEAQYKIANIHYKEMEKPDRDYTHALRAEQEYRNMILQFPDSPLVPQAKQRLLEVQEVLAEREFRVAHFYYVRESYPASIARLKSVIQQYPLYSHADEALWLLGQCYEGEIINIRANPKANEVTKARAIQELTKDATQAYDQILTRYPLMERAPDAKERLIELHQPVPKPTKAAVAQNRKEMESRKEVGMVDKVMGSISKHPNVASATHVGEPTLVDPPVVSATQVVKETAQAMAAPAAGEHSVSVETIKGGTPPPSEPAPRSDQPATNDIATVSPTSAQPAINGKSTTPGAPGNSNKLTPNVGQTPSSNELTPNVSDVSGQPLPPPTQVNEIQNGSGTQPQTASAAGGSDSELADDDAVSSSKPKKKKGLKKLVPF